MYPRNVFICLFLSEKIPTPVFLGFPGASAGKESACNAGDLDSIPRLGRFPREGKGRLLQYSGLENSRDSIHGVTKGRTRLSNFHFTLKAQKLTHFIKSSIPGKLFSCETEKQIQFCISLLLIKSISLIKFNPTLENPDQIQDFSECSFFCKLFATCCSHVILTLILFLNLFN